MKPFHWLMLLLSFLSLSSVALSGEDPSSLAPCTLGVGVTTQIGSYRTWTNALETTILEEKGFAICQDDAILNLPNESRFDRLPICRPDFRLELLFGPGSATRNVTVFKRGKILFDRDYPPNPTMVGSLKILKTVPSCSELRAIYLKVAK